jgi:ketosteroid isomerase-like protein
MNTMFPHFRRRTPVKSFCFLGLPGLMLCSLALAGELPADLAKAVKDYDEAQIHGNRTELERLVADDYTLLNSSDKIQDKAGLIADYTAPGFSIEPFEILEPVEKVWTDGAVMGGLVHLKGKDGGKPFAVTLRFSDIWAKRNGRWQVIYTHVSRPPVR